MKRTVTFVQTTISEVKQTTSGHWTVDNEHAQLMKDLMKQGGVVGKVLNALAVNVDSLSYDDAKEEFVAKTKNPEDTVRFVLITSCELPPRTGAADHGNTKYDMRNLVIVYRSEVVRLGIVFTD